MDIPSVIGRSVNIKIETDERNWEKIREVFNSGKN